ncbi:MULTISPECIES: glycoside hydrolase family 28 protein [unclassified Brevundimonas]|uniref:glycoside hydrolase family 28 protein n=1 Tax=unclassified Brevundimonas TaxID=2622653 RepID=UPI000CFABA11|nr:MULTISPECIES: glycosyl hydrolase family 28 protein [unclassified Brevundimonas]PRA20879.1 exo-poly-alpha-D-galacturonosidase [Brevundimonas sp. MYb27]PQZ77418.1 exo-poly-alpha-D-galacturonosidase [Brevundimonas sp. MYb31]PRB13207.1 exo-poly-alpha-D-galacturonosidase [Brevundimonas sp. MYb52]PRB33833.1 exo-poly-alpha-D-galacturonosidase [Brevundimonas sp. MYb46]PRB41766.1 exo-poly-alpha-D-galacturonosidase [Brevundimonas sp. MYb33]
MHRRSLLQLGLTGAIATAAPPAFAQTTGRMFDAADFGAVGDGETINTRPILAAIDAAAGAGGGTVVLKPGVYLSGSLFVKSNVTLLIGRGATIKGLRDIAAYPMVRTRVAGIEMEWPAGLLNIYREKNAKITGEGLVDGDGKVFWDSYWAMRRDYDPKDLRWAADYDCRRPRLIHVYDSEAVEVSGLNLARSGFWTVHVCYSRDVKVSDLIIRNNLGGRGPSTDGVDIDSSERVLVERCDIAVNDDALCIKAGRDWDGLRVARPCRQVKIRDCVVRDAHAGMTFGSETSGGFEDIEVSGLRIEYPVPLGIFFKSGHTRGGVINNIALKNIHLQDVATLFRVNLNWYPNYSYAQIPAGITDIPDYWRALATPVPREQGIPRIRDVRLSDIKAVGGKIGFEAAAYEEAPLRDFTFDRLDWDVREAGSIANADNWRFSDCKIDTLDGTGPKVTASRGVVGL